MLQVSPLFSPNEFGVSVAVPNDVAALQQWFQTAPGELASLVQRHGVVRLRGLDSLNDHAFSQLATAFSIAPGDYMYRSTPRSLVAPRVMTATEYPASEPILLHNENAYQTLWPSRLLFGCVQAPSKGGQTTVADMRAVTDAIPTEIVQAFEQRGVWYVRHYHDGFDLDWRTVFQCDDRAGVEAFCRANNITFEWLDSGVLRTGSRAQGTHKDPDWARTLWFNQAHLFHVSALGDGLAEDLRDVFGDALPRDAKFGDGGEIPKHYLDCVRNAYAEQERCFDWQVGDLLVVDNVKAAHGRRPFEGGRRVLVSMDFS